MVTLAMVTYLDRACIGAMASSIRRDFGLSESQMGWVFFSFMLAYAIFEIPTARWADRRGAKTVLTRIVTWWSVFTLATAASWNYASLLVMRFLFGAGEAGAFPCVARVLSRWMPFRERATAKGIFFAGAYTAGAITLIAVNALLPHFTWREILVGFGIVGFVWVAAWQWWFRDEPTDHPAANDAERQLILADRHIEKPPPRGWAYWSNLLKQRNVFLLCLMYMPNCATFYYCITWMPTYFEERHGFTKIELGLAASAPLAAAVITQFFGGVWSDWLTRRAGVSLGRRVPGMVGYGVAGIFIVFATLTNDPMIAVLFLSLTTASCMLTTAPAWSTCVDIGRENAATVSATMNTAGQFAALAMAPIAGYSVELTHSWNAPFWILTGLFAMGVLCWAFVDPRRPVQGQD
jgi:ACS family glucarate transporter-like MFS transporter